MSLRQAFKTVLQESPRAAGTRPIGKRAQSHVVLGGLSVPEPGGAIEIWSCRTRAKRTINKMEANRSAECIMCQCLELHSLFMDHPDSWTAMMSYGLVSHQCNQEWYSIDLDAFHWNMLIYPGPWVFCVRAGAIWHGLGVLASMCCLMRKGIWWGYICLPLKVTYPFLKALAQALVDKPFNLLQRKRDSIWPRPDDAHASWHFAGVPERSRSELLPPIPEARWVTLAPNPRESKTKFERTGGFSGLGTELLRWTSNSAIEGQNSSIGVASRKCSTQNQTKHSTAPRVPDRALLLNWDGAFIYI